MTKVEIAYYQGVIRLWITRPKGEDTEVFLKYIARKYKVPFKDLMEFHKAYRFSVQLMEGEDLDKKERDRIRDVMYPKPDWAVHQNWRMDWGTIIEDQCEHGVGHPNIYWAEMASKKKKREGKPDNTIGVHGCDGCCHKTKEKPPTYDDPWDAT